MPASSSNSVILQPKLLVVNIGSSNIDQNEIECSMHTLPKPLLREFGHVFGEKYLTEDVSATDTAPDTTEDAMDEDPPSVPSSASTETQEQHLELIAIPTNQRARCDLVAVGDDVEQEKDRLLNVVCRQFPINTQLTLLGICLIKNSHLFCRLLVDVFKLYSF